MSSATSITVPLRIERPRRPWQHAPGLVIVAALVAAGFALNQQIPSASPLLWAMGLGILAAPLVHGRASTTAGIKLSATHLLRVGVALLGLSISLGELASVGAGGIIVAAGTITATMLVTLRVARLIGVPEKLGLLIATGSAIIIKPPTMAKLATVLPIGVTGITSP